ncbi:MAG: C4-type zinc ribbon domain-containing protein [Syntrophobacterales bacterium]|nr:C4-type zinc ribbon domain-containing protein [Syntrophobacterales bacterium]
MNDQLKYLIQFQALENKRKAFHAELEDIPKRKAKLEKEFNEFESQYLMKRTELDHLRKLYRDLEKQVAMLEERLRRARQKESEVKTNKEYRALLAEQEEIKREIAEKEDQMLECMEKTEHLQKEVRVLEGQVAEKREKLQKELSELDIYREEIGRKLLQLDKIQEELKNKLDEQLKRKCEFLMVKKGGVAVAPVEKGVCRVCHVSLPPQKFIELQKDESLMHCPHCQRFIYWPQHERYASAEKEILTFISTS